MLIQISIFRKIKKERVEETIGRIRKRKERLEEAFKEETRREGSRIEE